LRTPVTVVESVIAGVLVEVATVPARPFADTTDTLVTAVDAIEMPPAVLVIVMLAPAVRVESV
jgi:hypothetical protein